MGSWGGMRSWGGDVGVAVDGGERVEVRVVGGGGGGVKREVKREVKRKVKRGNVRLQ